MDDKLRIVNSILENNDIPSIHALLTQIYDLREDILKLALQKKISEEKFYQLTALLKPQSRSALWEKYFIKKNHATKVSRQENAGDFILNETRYEYKVSGFNNTNSMNIIQVRLWQNCDYIIQYIEASKRYTFKLSHAQMKREVELCNAASAHGTKIANINNENVELGFSVKINSANWERWKKNYLVRRNRIA